MDNTSDFDNFATARFAALSNNEAFSRTVAAAFLVPLNPTINELTDVKTAVSEAVTNSIIHGYDGRPGGWVELSLATKGRCVFIEVSDTGVGIDDVNKAREPLFTTKPNEERSGMGFTVMESFMDAVEVESALGKGTRVKMRKVLV